MKQESVQRIHGTARHAYIYIILISRTRKRCMIIVVLCMILAYFSAQ